MNILNKRILSLIAIVLFVCLATQAQPPEFKRTADPNYSPDGKFIVYSASISKGSDEVSKGLSIMSADGTKIKSLTPNVNDLFDGFPAFSPDGKRIVFLRGIGKAYPDVWVINSDGSGLKQLTKTKENELRPEFNHDGTGVVFVRNVSRSWSSEYGSLHSIDLTSFTEQQILASDYQVTHAVPTSRGLYLVAMAKFDATGNQIVRQREIRSRLSARPAKSARKLRSPYLMAILLSLEFRLHVSANSRSTPPATGNGPSVSHSLLPQKSSRN
ncbi:MAG: PD40 domain-containing protein [Chloracidobacterium sp.]|nr:PD40 domain-containing protein [Chloracidobacterium sp.]